VETYLGYLGNLRAIRSRSGLPRVADVDMALWVLHERCYGQHRDPEIQRLYLEDEFMLQLRAKNLVAPLAELSHAKLAKALEEVKPDIATLIACHHFEVLIRKLASCYGLEEACPSSDLEEILDAIPNYGPVNPLRKARWQRLREIRNHLMHEGKMPGMMEKRVLIEEVNRLESEISRIRAGIERG